MRFRYIEVVLVLVTLLFGGQAASLRAAPAAPPPPKQYDVRLRFRISAIGTDRLEQYATMMKTLEGLGFRLAAEFEENPQDTEATRLPGTVPAANARRLLDDIRVKSLLLTPAGYKPPAEPNALLKVQIDLASGYVPIRQRELAEQSAARLRLLGFREAVGYDNRGHTRLLGLIPVGQLETLLKDLRWQPSGWLAPAESVDRLPEPLRSVSPILVTEVLPEPAAMTPPQGWGEPAERIPFGDPALKIDPALRSTASSETLASSRNRVEILLSASTDASDLEWRRLLRTVAPSLSIEGHLGTVVTGLVSRNDIDKLAALPLVSGVRMPKLALPLTGAAMKIPADNASVLRTLGADRYFARGFRGRGIHIAIVDGDFRGYERFRGKEFPQSIRYVDLTAERNHSVLPDPVPGDAAGVGTGTQAALAARLAAPDADITLVRIDAAAPYQLAEVVRLLNGERFFSDALLSRNNELEADAINLRLQRDQLLKMREEALGIFTPPYEPGNQPKDVLRRKEMEANVRKKEAYLKAQAEYDKAVRELEARRERYFALIEARENLREVRIVSCGMIWHSGYPVDGQFLTRFLDEHPLRSATWFQAAGDARGQAWTGLFHDADGNGAMEFIPAAMPLAGTIPSMAASVGRLRDWWLYELNFLGWRPFSEEPSANLPAQTRVRLAVQWQEAHEPGAANGGDAYRRPIANPRLVVLRQRDPSGTKVTADEFDVVARSRGLPQRLANRPGSATYEQIVEFTPPSVGRYALRVEGQSPGGSYPIGTPGLNTVRVHWELRPRIFVENIDAASRRGGRVVFQNYTTDLGTLGTPADSRSLVTIGAASLIGERRDYSTNGPPYLRPLLKKPNAFAADQVNLSPGSDSLFGTGVAAPLSAGLSATMLSSGPPAAPWQKRLGGPRPGFIVCPP